jgi:hypothetical protein
VERFPLVGFIHTPEGLSLTHNSTLEYKFNIIPPIERNQSDHGHYLNKIREHEIMTLGEGRGTGYFIVNSAE